MMAPVVMYESDWCGYCRAARRLFATKGWNYESRIVDGAPTVRAEAHERSGRTSVPQIFIGDHHVGGFDELATLESDGELDTLRDAPGENSDKFPGKAPGDTLGATPGDTSGDTSGQGDA